VKAEICENKIYFKSEKFDEEHKQGQDNHVHDM
jgi:hypothetical protein